MKILGISAFYHDSAATLIEDGRIVAAAQEERFSRAKADASFPAKSIAYCLAEGACTLDEIDAIVFYEKPFLKFERLLDTYLEEAPRGLSSFKIAMPLWIKEKLFQRSLLEKELRMFSTSGKALPKLLFSDHHLSHAASAYYPSPFDDAVVLTMDGVGEWATTTAGFGRGSSLELTKEIRFPHSLGLLYSAFTYYTGFKVNSGEYKVMGLAPYGKPVYASIIRDKLIDIREDGSFWLDQSFFNYCTGLTMTNARFDELFGGPARKPGDELTQRQMDLAASIQQVTEEVVLKITRHLSLESGSRNLCLAGGVALNCVANGKVLRDGRFENIFVQPAAGDAGGSLGAALAVYYRLSADSRRGGPSDSMAGSYLGPRFDQPEVERVLSEVGAQFEALEEREVLRRTVEALIAGKAVGWFQGRMEFGPRSLGARSILADPRNSQMQRNLNMKVKFRESFRPFAPSILREDLSEWFDLAVDSPYMLLVADVAKDKCLPESEAQERAFGIERLNAPRSEIPAVTHVDYSARVQTVHKETNAKFHALISEFKAQTGCPVLVNTSFNVRGEPIVCAPEDAYRCFMGTELDVLVIENCFLTKAAQRPNKAEEYWRQFELD